MAHYFILSTSRGIYWGDLFFISLGKMSISQIWFWKFMKFSTWGYSFLNGDFSTVGWTNFLSVLSTDRAIFASVYWGGEFEYYFLFNFSRYYRLFLEFSVRVLVSFSFFDFDNFFSLLFEGSFGNFYSIVFYATL